MCIKYVLLKLVKRDEYFNLEVEAIDSSQMAKIRDLRVFKINLKILFEISFAFCALANFYHLLSSVCGLNVAKVTYEKEK